MMLYGSRNRPAVATASAHGAEVSSDVQWYTTSKPIRTKIQPARAWLGDVGWPTARHPADARAEHLDAVISSVVGSSVRPNRNGTAGRLRIRGDAAGIVVGG